MTFWKDKNVLVTGASGFLGSWLTRELLVNDSNVFALIRDLDPRSQLMSSGLINKVGVIQGALEEFSSIERAINENEIDTVFHLGAQTIVGVAYRSPLSTFDSNIRGTYNLLEACRIHKASIKRVVIASSDKAYGSSTILPYTEDMPLQGAHPYDVSKSCADLISSSYATSYNLPVVIARCGNLYGGGDLNWSRLIPGLIRDYFNHKTPKIRSNGTYTRDYLYVEDAVKAYMLLAEQLIREDVIGQSFNFGPNKPYSVTEIIKQVKAHMNIMDETCEIMNLAGDEIRHQSLDSSKARRKLGWQPQYDLQDGLSETIKWYEEYLLKANRNNTGIYA